MEQKKSEKTEDDIVLPETPSWYAIDNHLLLLSLTRGRRVRNGQKHVRVRPGKECRDQPFRPALSAGWSVSGR